jgi:hypothetical protein
MDVWIEEAGRKQIEDFVISRLDPYFSDDLVGCPNPKLKFDVKVSIQKTVIYFQ